MRFKKSSCPVCSLFFVFSNYLYPALCVTFMLPPHSVAFVFGRNRPVSHLKKILDLSVWNIKPGSCCAAGSFRISSANLAQLPSSSTLLPFPADSGFSPPVCEHFPPPLALWHHGVAPWDTLECWWQQRRDRFKIKRRSLLIFPTKVSANPF